MSKLYEKAMKETNPQARAVELAQLAEKQSDAGDRLGAESSLRSASDSCSEIESPSDRCGAMNTVAEAQCKLGMLTDAKKLLKEVRKSSEKVEDISLRIAAVAKMSQLYGEYLDNPDAATGHLASIEPLALKVEVPENKVRAMLDIASAYQQVKATESAQKWAHDALEYSQSLEDMRKRTDCIAEVAYELMKMKYSDEGQKTLEEAQQSAGKIEDPLSRGYALVNLAEKESYSAQKARARKTLDEAEAAAEQVKDTSLKTSLMDKINAQRGKL